MLQSEGLVDPARTKDQKRILKQMERGEDADWDCGDDGKSGEYGIYDSIPWWPMKRRFWIIRSDWNIDMDQDFKKEGAVDLSKVSKRGLVEFMNEKPFEHRPPRHHRSPADRCDFKAAWLSR
jgi:hypothetical protein